MTADAADNRPNDGACTVNEVPRNGQVLFHGVRVHSEDIVPRFGTVRYTCNNNHYVNGIASNFCVDGNWSNTVPNCEPKCKQYSFDLSENNQ